MTTLYDIPAPAKLNLFLHIVGRRADGYHLLQTVFRFINLSDRIHFEKRTDKTIDRAADLPNISEKNDLTLRAARALQYATGATHGVRITLEKNIPIGAGLGGGSSNAASTLIALNRLWNTGLSRQALMQIGISLGADVPVFIFGQSAFAQGIGERLTPLLLPEAAYLIAQPKACVSTAEIYSAQELTRNTPYITIENFLEQPHSKFGRNDMQSVVYQRYPVIEKAAADLSRWLGQEPTNIRMSGSGACIFVEYSDFEQAFLAQKKIAATIATSSKMQSKGNTSFGAQQTPCSQFHLLQACSAITEHPLRHWLVE